MFESQRRDSRVPANLLLYVEQKDQNGQMRMNTVGQVLNISEGGLLAQVHYPVDETLQLGLTLALGAECIELRPRLTRLKSLTPNCYQIAIQIDRRARKIRRKIAAFIENRAPAQAA